ncbi:MAG TPA: DUF202 domain-containing protein [Candidatus Dormibacteraeota bacterium]|nr:DUF202 domain-containing protein [Candidatus Dormibacteraeota bacterium]
MDANTTRDHLANERTFLAYVRTALAFIAFGFVIARFSLFLRTFAVMQGLPQLHPQASTAFGIMMVFTGIAVAIFALYRYKRQYDAIAADRGAPLDVRHAAVFSAVLVLVGIVVAYELYRLT